MPSHQSYDDDYDEEETLIDTPEVCHYFKHNLGMSGNVLVNIALLSGSHKKAPERVMMS